MPLDAQHTDNASQQGLFPLSPEMLRRLFAEHDARVSRLVPPTTPECEDA